MRSLKQLKALWKNLKACAKDDLTDFRKKQTKTGGGEGRQRLGVFTERVLALIPGQATPLTNRFDDDAGMHREIICFHQSETDSGDEEIPAPPLKRQKSSDKNHILDMAKKEHVKKMENLELENKVLLLQKKKLEMEIQALTKSQDKESTCTSAQRESTNVQANVPKQKVWQPFF